VKDHIANAARAGIRSKWFEWIARVGYLAKGIVFAVIGGLAVRVAFGDWSEDADPTGAIEKVAELPYGSVLLTLLAAGLAAYSLWRITLGVADIDEEGTGARALATRSIYVWIGLVYGAFSALCVAVLLGWRRGSEDGVTSAAGTVMQLPAGTWLVGIAGGVVMVAGARELFVALSGGYRDEFRREELNAAERIAALATGFYGHAARGAAFMLSGVLAIRAALNFDPDEARGLAGSFRELAGERYGTVSLFAIAAGFITFGIYCGLLALHRHIPDGDTGSARRR
jgi:hypothetical protein